MIAPQADDIDKILDLPLAIAEGANTKHLVTKRYGFDGRQADYYLEAGEMLGLVRREDGLYTLSEDGKKYRRMDPTQQKLMIIRKMIATPLVSLILGELFVSEDKKITREQIEGTIEENTGIHRTTVGRRAQTLMSWFRWIGEETHAIHADSNVVRLATTGPVTIER